MPLARCYDPVMPSASFIRALSRLDQAVTAAEAACDALIATAPGADPDRDARVRAAIAEIDTMIDALRANADRTAHG